MALKYNVGDKVRIKSLDWYNENINNKGVIVCGSESFTHPMSHFCNEVVNIITIQDNCYRIIEDGGDWYWTDEMIEGLVEEENKPKFKVGDKVILDPYPCVVTDVTWRDSLHGFVYTVRGVDFGKMVGEEDLIFDTSEEEVDLIPKFGEYGDNEPLDIPTMTTEFVKEHGLPCPEGYQFVDENGNIINATKVVLEKKKKKYPKTYEECCEILGLIKVELCFNADYRSFYASMEQWKKLGLMNQLYQLLVCRDAYWKLCGEEMGLGKPWEPDYNDEKQLKYGLYDIIKYSLMNPSQFAFPTAEMRDAFYENFKELIERCKNRYDNQ